MYYTYILKSLKDGSNYYGLSSKVEERLKQHNAGKSKYTKGHRPFKVHYFELYQSKKEAIARERFFKSKEGYRLLKDNGII